VSDEAVHPRRLPRSSLIGSGVAMLILAAVGAVVFLTNASTRTQVTERNVGIGSKIEKLENGVPLSAVVSELGRPDARKTQGLIPS